MLGQMLKTELQRTNTDVSEAYINDLKQHLPIKTLNILFWSWIKYGTFWI